jgi:hypothetical protein
MQLPWLGAPAASRGAVSAVDNFSISIAWRQGGGFIIPDFFTVLPRVALIGKLACLYGISITVIGRLPGHLIGAWRSSPFR